MDVTEYFNNVCETFTDHYCNPILIRCGIAENTYPDGSRKLTEKASAHLALQFEPAWWQTRMRQKHHWPQLMYFHCSF